MNKARVYKNRITPIAAAIKREAPDRVVTAILSGSRELWDTGGDEWAY